MKQQELKKKLLRHQKGQEVYDELARRAAKTKHMEEVARRAAAAPLGPLTRKQQVQKGIKERKLRSRKQRMMNRYWDASRDKSKLHQKPLPYSGRTKQELAAQMAEIRKWQRMQDAVAAPVQPAPVLPVSHPDPVKTEPIHIGQLPTGIGGHHLVMAASYLPHTLNMDYVHHMEDHATSSLPKSVKIV